MIITKNENVDKLFLKNLKDTLHACITHSIHNCEIFLGFSLFSPILCCSLIWLNIKKNVWELFPPLLALHH